jgi:hypothetical protein
LVPRAQAKIPVVFANGNLLGGADEVLQMNETGKLKEILKGFEVAAVANCEACGGAGYGTEIIIHRQSPSFSSMRNILSVHMYPCTGQVEQVLH